MQLIKKVAEKNITMVIVTHEMQFARDVSDTVYFMDGGVIVEKGRPAEIFTNPKVERTRQFLSRFISLEPEYNI